MNLTINSTWSVSGEGHNWTTHQWYDGKDRDGNHKRHSKELYYSNLKTALMAICEKSLQGCEVAEEILDRLDTIQLEISEALKNAGIK